MNRDLSLMGHIIEISLEQLEKMNSRKNNVNKNIRSPKSEMVVPPLYGLPRFASGAMLQFDTSVSSDIMGDEVQAFRC